MRQFCNVNCKFMNDIDLFGKDAELYSAYTKVKKSIDVDIIVEDKEDFLNGVTDTLINM